VNGPPAELRARLIQAAYEAAVAEGRYAAPKARRAPARARLYRDGRLTLLAPHFDYAYYAHENSDFSASGLDELEHFNFFGWRNLRNPAAWFDTAYYLAGNPDVLASGDNPFWHYVFKGRAEGRAPRRPRGPERAILDALDAPRETQAPDLPRLDAQALADCLAHAPGLVYSVAPGDASAEEARALKALGFLHLQAAPLRFGATLTTLPAAWSQTRLTLDGETLGVAADAVIAKALASLGDALPARRALVVRGAQGASAEGILAVASALAPQKRLFWLDDFSSLCASPRLLRNDIAYCAAPPPSSQACAICVHGEARRPHLAAMRALFEGGRFTVVAPSEAALKLWRGAADLPHEAARVEAPATLEGSAEALEDIPEIGEIGVEARPVRVAFLGPPTLAAGWLTFERILETCGELAAYAFHHFAPAEALRPSRNLIAVETAASARDLMIERRIDLVVAAGEGPEAFSLAAIEAIAAGADLAALAHSGHPAELVERRRRGRVFASDDEVVDFFVSGKAIAYARERARFPRQIQDVRLRAVAAALAAEEACA
jgi:hypothetical protein